MTNALKLSAPEQRSSFDTRLLSLTLTICLVAAMFGKPLSTGGKLASSNVAQVLIFALLFFHVPRFKLGQHLVALLIVVSSLAASCYTYFSYGLFGKPLVVVFVLLSVAFVFMVCNLFEVTDFDFDDMRRAVQPAVWIASCMYVVFILNEIVIGDGISLGMDDKSHASIYLGFLSFLSLRFLQRGRFVFALYFLFISLFSISRLAFVFAPCIFAMMIGLIVLEGSFLTKVRTAIVLVVLFALAVWFIENNPDYFKVLDRVSSADEIAGSDSSLAHKLLLIKGIELKFHSPMLFVLGTSPGSFADILLRSGVSYTDLSVLDPAFVSTAWEGRAPIHSTHMAIFVEYSIFVFVVYAVYIASLFVRAFMAREYMVILFLVPFFVSVLFYSAHNKFYFFVVAAVLEVTLRMSRRKQKRLPNDTRRKIGTLPFSATVSPWSPDGGRSPAGTR